MLETYRVVYSGGEKEIVEKKSRFIATIFPINTEEEANDFIEKVRKKHFNASHHCFSYVIGDKHQIQRISDDGEPSGTAGRPMLDVLLGEDIHNVLVVVTRYFGGTLLGTGGLVRAYSKAVQAGLTNSIILEKRLGVNYTIQTDYNGIGKVQYIIGQLEFIMLDTEYTDIVKADVLVPIKDCNQFEQKVTEATNGKAKIVRVKEMYFGIVQGNVIFF
ncbi:MAG: YigZ family protein [Velocimicrobium sp.]